MTLELTYLVWSALLGFIYISVQAAQLRRQMGIEGANMTRDDEPAPDLMAGRANRALRNFAETYPLFIALVAAVALSNGGDWMTAWGCHLYFWSRAVYLPLYLFGITPWRSVVWTLSLVGLVLLFIGALI